MPSVIMLNVTYKPLMLSVIMLNGIMLIVVMLNVTYKSLIVNVVMLSVIMLSVVAPLNLQHCFFTIIVTGSDHTIVKSIVSYDRKIFIVQDTARVATVVTYNRK